MIVSMFDLLMKDKIRFFFVKLKDKMKGRKNDGIFFDTFFVIILSFYMFDVSIEFLSGEILMKFKLKKFFFLGFQRFFLVYLMFDLIGIYTFFEKFKFGVVGYIYFFGRQIEFFGVVSESGE